LSKSNEILTEQLTHPETGYKFGKLHENRARGTPLRGVYIPHFDQISVKISVLGVLYRKRCTDGMKFGTSSVPNFTPSVQRVAPAGRKPQNRPMSKLNTGALRFAQCCQ